MSDSYGTYKDELVMLLHKSQDAFEKQLNFIASGSLVLSIGFIKEVLTDAQTAKQQWLLTAGWALLALTLFLNCCSHLLAARKHNTTIAELNSIETFCEKRIAKRYAAITNMNWATVITMCLGITLIIIFISINFTK